MSDPTIQFNGVGRWDLPLILPRVRFHEAIAADMTAFLHSKGIFCSAEKAREEYGFKLEHLVVLESEGTRYYIHGAPLYPPLSDERFYRWLDPDAKDYLEGGRSF